MDKDTKEYYEGRLMELSKAYCSVFQEYDKLFRRTVILGMVSILISILLIIMSYELSRTNQRLKNYEKTYIDRQTASLYSTYNAVGQ